GGCVAGTATIPDTVSRRLAAESERHAQATLSRSLEQNNRYFHEAREKLERWADDMVLSAEKALADTKEQIKALRRQARQATTLPATTQRNHRTGSGAACAPRPGTARPRASAPALQFFGSP